MRDSGREKGYRGEVREIWVYFWFFWLLAMVLIGRFNIMIFVHFDT